MDRTLFGVWNLCSTLWDFRGRGVNAAADVLAQIVAQPMDLSTVARRLEEGAYRSAVKMYRNVQLVSRRFVASWDAAMCHSWKAPSSKYPLYGVHHAYNRVSLSQVQLLIVQEWVP